ncbi:YhcH/YjgK/YiaL family protein [Mycoplasma sp. Ms02]|uniref:YhcH/YjgK/YiaL family protein n=1 Tax=Mycoplasma sp. Ms02 TaxID=353851 RepID=UPI001C8902E6|nr:YhcH/YjgK/YiaL family protein [Mycoplasma sp. Ms02]QZE12355.1 YhcH/YjgK/YiaL family protein [Mycoplasma sp. Ms02]
MIIDSLKNSKKYGAIDKRLARAFEWLENNDYQNLELGKHVIDEDLFFVHRTLDVFDQNDFTCEVHEKYADIHLFKEEEVYGYVPVSYTDLMEKLTDYDQTMDVTFYRAKSALGKTAIAPNHFMLFLPGEIHCPGIVPFEKEFKPNQKVSKFIMKVKMD